MQYFAAHGVECCILPLPTNEANKGFDLVFEIARHLEDFKLNRRDAPLLRLPAPDPWPMTFNMFGSHSISAVLFCMRCSTWRRCAADMLSMQFQL